MNLPVNARKGIFPHGLMSFKNLADKYPLAIGKFPSKNYFYTNRMSSKEYDFFLRWHRINTLNYSLKKLRYNLRAKLKTYCSLDVEILRLGCEFIRKWFKEKTGIDCLVEKQTLSSACFAYFRSSCMEKNSLPNISPLGLQPETISSTIAESYILYLGRKNRVVIQSYLSGREHQVGPYR